LNTKYEIVKELITDEQLDVFSCQETWHCVTNDPILQAATPSGYQFIDAVRKDQPGFGGLCIFFKNSFKSCQLKLPDLTSFECVGLELCDAQSSVSIISIYRSPSDGVNDFIIEFDDLLDRLSSFGRPVVITGDLNVHWEVPHILRTARLMKMVFSQRLEQHIESVTHRKGGVIDVVLTDAKGLITNIAVEELREDITDHSIITFTYTVQAKIKKQVSS